MAAAVIVPIIPAIQLKRILYATDFSDGSRAALSLALAVARRYHSEILVAHICPVRTGSPVTSDVHSDRKHGREVKDKLADLLRVTDAGRFSTGSIVKTGDPAEELQRI